MRKVNFQKYLNTKKPEQQKEKQSKVPFASKKMNFDMVNARSKRYAAADFESGALKDSPLRSLQEDEEGNIHFSPQLQNQSNYNIELAGNLGTLAYSNQNVSQSVAAVQRVKQAYAPSHRLNRTKQNMLGLNQSQNVAIGHRNRKTELLQSIG